MSVVKILIVEDDLHYAVELEVLIDELGYDVLAVVDNADSVFQILKTDRPDVILMDIKLKGSLNGIEVAKRIEEEQIPIIFITSFIDKPTFEKAKGIRNFGYVVKPFNHFTLESVIEVALMNTQNEPIELPENGSAPNWEEDLILKDYVFIKKRSRLDKVAIEDIQYLESDGNYCTIKTVNQRYILKMSLKKASEILSAQNFLRVNRSHVLNMKCITSIELSDNLITIESQGFTIGRAYKEKVLKQLKLLT